MASILSCHKVSKSFHSKTLFENITFNLHEGDHCGLIGPNGVGKSTLLRMMAGLEPASEGDIACRKGTKVAYVPQDTSFAAEANSTLSELGIIHGKVLGLEELDCQVQWATILSQMDFEDFEIKVSQLSGGWKKRLSIALSQLGEPDLIFFDEPTNHLDLRAILWLEGFLKKSSFSWLCVSHDRFFLSRTTSRIIELNPSYEKFIFDCSGNYDQFLVKRDEYFDAEFKRQDSLKNQLRKEDEWLSRQPKARTTKSQARIDRAYSMHSELSQVSGRLKQDSAGLEFVASDRKTKKLVSVEDMSKSFGEKKIVEKFSFDLTSRKIIGLLGDNGSGKSTLLKLLSGMLKQDSGKIKIVDNLEIVYFDQNKDHLLPEWTLKRALSETGDTVLFRDRPVHVAGWAKRFQFEPTHLDVKVADLSGGEKARVLIARLMLRKADLLVLDEPTNDLDLPTLETLEESLESFGGAVLIVSHDRFLMSRVCDSFLGLDGKGGVLVYASYEQWERELQKGSNLDAKSSKREKNSKKTMSTASSASKKSKSKLSYLEQREFDGMEENILKIETKLSELGVRISDPAIASQSLTLRELASEEQELRSKLESLFMRWSELENLRN